MIQIEEAPKVPTPRLASCETLFSLNATDKDAINKHEHVIAVLEPVSPLLSLPPELKELIFIRASCRKLAYVNREFHQISESNLIRALWLIERYGSKDVLARCWRWRFLRKLPREQVHSDDKQTSGVPRRWMIRDPPSSPSASNASKMNLIRKKPCDCQKVASLVEGIDVEGKEESRTSKAIRRFRYNFQKLRDSESRAIVSKESVVATTARKPEMYKSCCPIEQTQILMVLQLLDLGACLHAGCEMALRVATRWGHLNLATILLQRGSDPNTVVFFPNTIGIKWKNKGKVGGGVPGDPQFIIQRPISLIEFQNQILVDAGLIMPLGPPPNPVPVTPVYSETATRFHKKHKQIPLLLQAVQSNNFKIVKLLLNGNRPISITKHSILVALREAFELEMIEMCKVLIEEGNVRPTSDILQNLVSRAGMWRLLCGMRNKLSPAICFAVQKLSNDDFDHLSASLVRSAAEIGSVDFLQVCIERGADVNIWNGHALHASVYNGNLEVTTHLLKPEVNASTENFGSRQKAFCIGLMIIEGFALIMFSLLLFLWVAALVGYIEMKISDLQPNNGEMEIGNGTSTWWSGSTGKSGSSAQDVTLGELSGMALPSSLALLVMYRLVPLHKMCIAYSRVCKEDKRRRLELQRRREAEEIRQLTQIQNVESLE